MLVSNCLSSVFACLLSFFFVFVSYLSGRSLARGGGGEETLPTMQKPLELRPQRSGLSKLTKYDY